MLCLLPVPVPCSEGRDADGVLFGALHTEAAQNLLKLFVDR